MTIAGLPRSFLALESGMFAPADLVSACNHPRTNDLEGQEDPMRGKNPNSKPPKTRLSNLLFLFERPGPPSKPGSFSRKSGSRPCGRWTEKSLYGKDHRVIRRRSWSWSIPVSMIHPKTGDEVHFGCPRQTSNSDILGSLADVSPRD